MSWIVAALVLLSAGMHAGWNAAVKVQADRFTMMAAIGLSWGALSLLAVPFVPTPDPASWPLLALSMGLHVGYNLFLVRAYRHGDLSQVYPIARGASPMLVLLFASIFAGEPMTPASAFAVLVISAGIMSLAVGGGHTHPGNGTTVAWALGTAMWVAGYTVSDGLGARMAGSAHGFIVWLNLLTALPLTLIGLARRGPAFVPSMRPLWRVALVSGAISMAGYWIVVWAMTQAPMAAVSALRETSVIIAAIIGTVLLKERFGAKRVLAATAVAGGVALMRLAG